MEETESRRRRKPRRKRERPGPLKFMWVGTGGAVIGAYLTLKVTRAIPKMMRQMMCGMMEEMAAEHGEQGLSREEL